MQSAQRCNRSPTVRGQVPKFGECLCDCLQELNIRVSFLNIGVSILTIPNSPFLRVSILWSAHRNALPALRAAVLLSRLLAEYWPNADRVLAERRPSTGRVHAARSSHTSSLITCRQHDTLSISISCGTGYLRGTKLMVRRNVPCECGQREEEINTA